MKKIIGISTTKNFVLPNFRGVIDTAEKISAVSMTPLKQFQWCH
jgi:hypothetical protein